MVTDPNFARICASLDFNTPGKHEAEELAAIAADGGALVASATRIRIAAEVARGRGLVLMRWAQIMDYRAGRFSSGAMTSVGTGPPAAPTAGVIAATGGYVSTI